MVPHSHVPELVQALALDAEQATHSAPPVPQWFASGGVTHAPPEQQPVGHEVASQTHTPALQRRPAPHGAPEPQAQAPLRQLSLWESQAAHIMPTGAQAAAVGVVQTLPAQQPVGHDVASQMQLPFEQR